jgi:hypothetical protein
VTIFVYISRRPKIFNRPKKPQQPMLAPPVPPPQIVLQIMRRQFVKR